MRNHVSPRLKIDFGLSSETLSVSTRLKHLVRLAVEETLGYEKFPHDALVSITFCDNAYIRELNRTYREKDSATDVLSFPQFEAGEAVNCPVTPVPLGDIVISLERAAVQAEELGNPFPREVAFLAVHSTLHLLGYDHVLSPADEEDMCARQRAVMTRLEHRLKEKEKESI